VNVDVFETSSTVRSTVQEATLLDVLVQIRSRMIAIGSLAPR
jgi:hypothetical protein